MRGATSKAMSAAMPALLGALARNASSGSGAEALASALSRDHDGGILDDLTGFLGKGDTSAGDGILGHVLGANRDNVAAGVSRSSGLDVSAVQKLLPMLAPVVLGMLGREQRAQSLDASGLASMLGQESRADERAAPGLVSSLLDADGDGSVLDDVARIGSGLLGGLLKGGR